MGNGSLTAGTARGARHFKQSKQAQHLQKTTIALSSPIAEKQVKMDFDESKNASRAGLQREPLSFPDFNTLQASNAIMGALFLAGMHM